MRPAHDLHRWPLVFHCHLWSLHTGHSTKYWYTVFPESLVNFLRSRYMDLFLLGLSRLYKVGIVESIQKKEKPFSLTLACNGHWRLHTDRDVGMAKGNPVLWNFP